PIRLRRRAALLEIASTVEPIQDGRIHIEKINGAFPRQGGTPAEYEAALTYAILLGWRYKHEFGSLLRFTPAGAELFA
ncbi:MAG TPA: hypothetical protein VMT98_00085, partial [Verrucomicrobiae bacterium]|nr:hypothetical protein [Verrucomicrobiae bacterium]